MNDEKIEEDHLPSIGLDKSLQDFQLFESQLLSMRPWWQKAFDWLDNHTIATIAIAVFGSVLLLVPTIFIIVTAIFCINSENIIKNVVDEMRTAWKHRHAPKPDTNAFDVIGFATDDKCLWLKPIITERREALRKQYHIELAELERKSPHTELAKQHLETIQSLLKRFHIVIKENELKIEEENNQAYIVCTSEADRTKDFNRFCLLMKTVFDLSPINRTITAEKDYNFQAEAIRTSYYDTAKFSLEKNTSLNQTALNLFEKGNHALFEVRDLINTIGDNEKVYGLKNEFIDSLNLGIGKNNEIILKSLKNENEAYEEYSVKDFSDILEERRKWFKNLEETLINSIGKDNFQLRYRLQEEVTSEKSYPKIHQTNSAFSFELIIKPEGFDFLLNNVENISENTISNRISNI